MKKSIIWHIYKFKKLKSTNLYAKQVGEKTNIDFALVIADTQTSAYGRFGRKWLSPFGGIWLSILLREIKEPARIQLLPLMCGVVVAKTIQRLYAITPALKWPNDVLIDDKKIAGILTECKIEDNVVKYVIIGIGINFDFDIQEIENELGETATTLKEKLKIRLEKDLFIRTLLEIFENEYTALKEGFYTTIISSWSYFSNIFDRTVKIELTDGCVIECTPYSISEDGSLNVYLPDGMIKQIQIGMCKNLRTQ